MKNIHYDPYSWILGYMRLEIWHRIGLSAD